MITCISGVKAVEVKMFWSEVYSRYVVCCFTDMNNGNTEYKFII